MTTSPDKQEVADVGLVSPPQSRLTLARPDIWRRALCLATDLTGYCYVDKAPLPGGEISACGGGWYEGPEETLRREKERLRDRKEVLERWEKLVPDADGDRIDKGHYPTVIKPEDMDEARREIEEIEEWIENKGRDASGIIIPVPEGAMEWLLHEVGHFVAATAAERRLPDYGFGIIKEKGWGRAREWQAWGFEEIILAPFGSSRDFAPPEHRGGVAWSRNGPMPDFATRHAARNLRDLRIDVEQWRALYGEWIAWETVQ